MARWRFDSEESFRGYARQVRNTLYCVEEARKRPRDKEIVEKAKEMIAKLTRETREILEFTTPPLPFDAPTQIAEGA